MIDNEMQSLVHLGFQKQNMSPCSLLIMLIARKNMNLKRIITDFRFLNNRSQRLNLAFPLIRCSFAILGSYKCKFLSALDLKEQIIPLSIESSKLPFVDLATYIYQGLPNLGSIYDRSKYLSILWMIYCYTVQTWSFKIP